MLAVGLNCLFGYGFELVLFKFCSDVFEDIHCNVVFEISFICTASHFCTSEVISLAGQGNCRGQLLDVGIGVTVKISFLVDIMA